MKRIMLFLGSLFLIIGMMTGCGEKPNPEFLSGQMRVGGNHSSVKLYFSSLDNVDSCRIFSIYTSFHKPEFSWAETLKSEKFPEGHTLTFVAIESDEYDDEEGQIEYFQFLGPGEWKVDSISFTVVSHPKPG